MTAALDLTKVLPWSTDTPDLLTRSLSHIAQAWLVMPDGERIDLTLTGGNVTFDETRSPRVSASLTCVAPADQGTLDRIDARTGARLWIAAGYHRPDGADDVQTLANLGLRSRQVSRPDNVMTLVGASDEAILIDAAVSSSGTVTNATTTGAITAVIQEILPAVTPTVTATTGPAVAATTFTDRWDVVNDLSDRVGANVYDDGTRAWWIAAAPVLATPVAELAVGPAGTIITSDANQSRDDGFANYVVVRYEWTPAAGGSSTVRTGARRITTGPYAAVAGNYKIARFDREVAATQAEADAAAAALVARTVTRGRSFSVKAIAAYWVRPGHTVVVDLPLGAPEGHLVGAVEFDLSDGTMTATTRLPDGAYTIGA